jgi:hypothetical protein
MEFPAYGSMEGTNFPKKRKINSTPKKAKALKAAASLLESR